MLGPKINKTVVLFLVFKGISTQSSIAAVSIYIPTNSARVSLFSTPSPVFIVCRLFDEGEREEPKSWLKAQHSENEDHGIWSHHFMGNRWGKSRNRVRLYFFGAPKSLQMVTAAMKLKDAYYLEEKL